MGTTSRLRRILEAAQRASADVAIDMLGVTFLDSTGLGALVSAEQRAAAHAGRFVLVDVKEAPRRMLHHAGLDDVFTFTTTLQDLTTYGPSVRPKP